MAAMAVSIQLVFDSVNYAAVFTSRDVRLPSRLPSEFSSTLGSAPMPSSHAFTSSNATPDVTGVVRGPKPSDVHPSTRTSLAEETTDSIPKMHPLVLFHIPAGPLCSFIATPGKAASKTKAVSSGK